MSCVVCDFLFTSKRGNLLWDCESWKPSLGKKSYDKKKKIGKAGEVIVIRKLGKLQRRERFSTFTVSGSKLVE